MTEVLLSATVLLCAVLLLRRALGDHISMRLRYALWALVLLRLLLPVSLPASPVSVLNALPERALAAPAVPLRSRTRRPRSLPTAA